MEQLLKVGMGAFQLLGKQTGVAGVNPVVAVFSFCKYLKQGEGIIHIRRFIREMIAVVMAFKLGKLLFTRASVALGKKVDPLLEIILQLLFCYPADGGEIDIEGYVAYIVQTGEDTQLAKPTHAREEHQSYIIRGALEIGIECGEFVAV